MRGQLLDHLKSKYLERYEVNYKYLFTEITTLREFFIVFSILKSRRTVIKNLCFITDKDSNFSGKQESIRKTQEKLAKLLREIGSDEDSLCVLNIQIPETLPTLTKKINSFGFIWLDILNEHGMSKKRATITVNTLKILFKEFMLRENGGFVDKVCVATGTNDKELRCTNAIYKQYKHTYTRIISPAYFNAKLSPLSFHEL